jgi:hypothetical protein
MCGAITNFFFFWVTVIFVSAQLLHLLFSALTCQNIGYYIMDNTIIDLDKPPQFHQEEWIGQKKKYTLARIFRTLLLMPAPML